MNVATDNAETLPLEPETVVIPPEPSKEATISPSVAEKRATYQKKLPPEGAEEDEETKEKNRLLRRKTLVMGEECFTESDGEAG